MRNPDYTVLFATRENPVKPANNEFSSKQIDIEITGLENNLVVGEYEYESDTMFGTSTTSNGHIVFDKKSPLVAVSKTHDMPKPYSLFDAVDSALNTDILTPDVSPRSQHIIYEKYGFGQYPNGYVVSFKENSSDYFDAGNSMGVTLDPEDEASERAKFSNERISDDMVHDIAQDAIDDGMHIWSCDLVLGEEEHTIGFSDPLRFTKVDRDWIQENNGFENLFSVCRDAL